MKSRTKLLTYLFNGYIINIAFKLENRVADRDICYVLILFTKKGGRLDRFPKARLA